MKNKIYIVIGLLSMVFSMSTWAQHPIKTDVFPKAQDGFKQVVIHLPVLKKGESSCHIQLFVGKDTATDTCNNYSLMGELEAKNLEGWGYTYYEFSSSEKIVKTLMMCPDSKKTTRFVHNSGKIIRYNSEVPLVVYLPESLDVRYKIWKTDDKMISSNAANQRAKK